MIPEHIIPRLWSRIDVRGKNECWPWKGHVIDSGYGSYNYADEGKSKRIYAHRAIAEVQGVLTDPAMVVRHLCGNRVCCNPAHLKQGTHKENAADRKAAGRHWVPRGTKHHAAVLNEEKVKIIRDLLSSGWKQADIAKLAGVSQQAISRIGKGERWSHVE